MDFVDGESASCSYTCVASSVDGTEEVSIKVEEDMEIKDEFPEAISFPPINTENVVRLKVCVCVCLKLWHRMLLGHLFPLEIVNLHLFVPCFLLYFECHMAVESCISFLKSKKLLNVMAINERIILKCILKK
jgi:hypothetical protein